jgi:hypothetical protein
MVRMEVNPTSETAQGHVRGELIQLPADRQRRSGGGRQGEAILGRHSGIRNHEGFIKERLSMVMPAAAIAVCAAGYDGCSGDPAGYGIGSTASPASLTSVMRAVMQKVDQDRSGYCLSWDYAVSQSQTAFVGC